MWFYRNAVLFHIIFVVTHGEIFGHLGHTGPLTVKIKWHCRRCIGGDQELVSHSCCYWNKANLRDLIAVTSLIISNWIQIINFYRPCDREIWWMTLKNNRTLFLYYVKLCASFQIHWWNQTGFTVQKRSIRVEIGGILSLWPWNLMDDLGKQWGTSSMLLQALCSIS